MGVLANVEGSIKTHPWLWGIGGVTSVIAVYFIFASSGGKSSSTPFSYSIGPSDATIAAATARQNQTAADQTAVSLANIAATSQQHLANTQAQALEQLQAGSNLQAGQEDALLNQLAGDHDTHDFSLFTQLLSKVGFGG